MGATAPLPRSAAGGTRTRNTPALNRRPLPLGHDDIDLDDDASPSSCTSWRSRTTPRTFVASGQIRLTKHLGMTRRNRTHIIRVGAGGVTITPASYLGTPARNQTTCGLLVREPPHHSDSGARTLLESNQSPTVNSRLLPARLLRVQSRAAGGSRTRKTQFLRPRCIPVPVTTAVTRAYHRPHSDTVNYSVFSVMPA